MHTGRWYASYPASEHLHDDRAYCCLSGIIWALARCYNGCGCASRAPRIRLIKAHGSTVYTESPSRITDCLVYVTLSCRVRQGSAFPIRRTGSGFLMGLHGSGFLQRSVRIRLSDPGPDFILHDQQQLGRPMGHMPPSPSMGHPGLPDLGTVDGTPMKYTHNSS